MKMILLFQEAQVEGGRLDQSGGHPNIHDDCIADGHGQEALSLGVP